MRPPARSSGDQGWRGRLLPPPRAPPRPGEAQGCSPGAHLLATEDTQQGGGAHREWKHSARGLTCGRTGHPVCLERVALVAPAEAPGPWVGPTILLAVAIVVGANQLALLVCGHRAQLTRPLVRAGSLVAAPPWARGQACTEEGDTLQTIQEGETGPGGPGSGAEAQGGHTLCGRTSPNSEHVHLQELPCSKTLGVSWFRPGTSALALASSRDQPGDPRVGSSPAVGVRHEVGPLGDTWQRKRAGQEWLLVKTHQQTLISFVLIDI